MRRTGRPALHRPLPALAPRKESFMRCKDIMKRQIECVSPAGTVEHAARRMRDQNIGFLPVCDESGQVVGTITDRDIAVRVVAERQPGTTPVEKVMTNEVVSCN